MNGSTLRAIIAAATISATGLLLVPALTYGQSPTPLRIMCVGDGNTVGYTDNPKWTLPFEFGFRSGLYTRLLTNGYSVQFVGDSPEPWNGGYGLPTNTPSPDLRALNQDHHQGYAGLGTGGALSSIAAWVTADDPDIVLLLVGIDDTDFALATSNLNSIVQTIVTTKPLANVIVAQITPLIYYSQFIVDYNGFINGTLVPSYQAQGKRVSTVNQYTNLLTNGSIDPALFSNGLNHPNAVAFDRMAETWYAGIQAIYPLPLRSWFTSLVAFEDKVVVTGAGGPSNGSFYLLSTTNLDLPLFNWNISTERFAFDTTGNFAITSSVPAGAPNLFFRLRIQ